ncbi:crustacean hyperglycemic hormones isoform X1 [Macrobrachium nipponense]|uniref:Macrobrachium nipponense hyperglycemic hormone protein n=1 Tax=Macrobrachium nipponense TaxID=159736 RepID=G0YP40_MACNP|nr:prepro-crustacean hyperglycemic hormone [Macrobrachium nipponense]AJM70549.1 hyperglycemic hormone [Macrobrachium nipponense]
MIRSSVMGPTMFLVVLLLVATHQTSAWSVDGLARIEKLLSTSSSASAASPTRGQGLNLKKRAILDQSCKGIFDRELFKKLDRVCDDCYNLYRKPYVAIDCREGCYQNLVFRQCIQDLQLMDQLDEYANAVQVVGK